MRFGHVLKEMVDSTSGGLAGTIVGRDGIAVENYIKTDKLNDVEPIAVAYSRMVEEIRKAGEVLNLGDIEEIMISATDLTAFVRMINKDYFISLITKSNGIPGKARFILKKTADMMVDEF